MKFPDLAALAWLQTIHCKATNLWGHKKTLFPVSQVCWTLFTQICLKTRCYQLSQGGCGWGVLASIWWEFPKRPGNAGSSKWITVSGLHSESFPTKLLRILLRKTLSQNIITPGNFKISHFDFSLIPTLFSVLPPWSACPSGCQTCSLPSLSSSYSNCLCCIL